MEFEPRPIPDQLHVVPLVDARIEEYGHAPLSPYIEEHWLPVLGPTALLLYRRLGTWAVQEPHGLSVTSVELAASFGLGEGLAANSKLGRAIGRLTMFDAAKWSGELLAVRRALPSVERHHSPRNGVSRIKG